MDRVVTHGKRQDPAGGDEAVHSVVHLQTTGARSLISALRYYVQQVLRGRLVSAVSHWSEQAHERYTMTSECTTLLHATKVAAVMSSVFTRGVKGPEE
jgi:hypothetical protein